MFDRLGQHAVNTQRGDGVLRDRMAGRGENEDSRGILSESRLDPTGDFALRRPGMDNVPTTTAPAGAPKEIIGTLTEGEGTPSDLPGSWPRLRGAALDNISKEKGTRFLAQLNLENFV